MLIPITTSLPEVVFHHVKQKPMKWWCGEAQGFWCKNRMKMLKLYPKILLSHFDFQKRRPKKKDTKRKTCGSFGNLPGTSWSSIYKWLFQIG